MTIKKELGKGKSGYSYIVMLGDKELVLKHMHYEPCEYYSFGDSNKVKLEVDAFKKLKDCNILIPKLITYDIERNYLIKEFIDGEVASQTIAKNKITDQIIGQLFEIFHRAKKAGINIDYFPTNFVIKNNHLYYIDYEYNPYTSKWDLLNWGIYYWANSDGFKESLSNGNVDLINDSTKIGIPIKKPFEETVANWKRDFDIKPAE